MENCPDCKPVKNGVVCCAKCQTLWKLYPTLMAKGKIKMVAK